jgi:hypothetical protein
MEELFSLAKPRDVQALVNKLNGIAPEYQPSKKALENRYGANVPLVHFIIVRAKAHSRRSVGAKVAPGMLLLRQFLRQSDGNRLLDQNAVHV